MKRVHNPKRYTPFKTFDRMKRFVKEVSQLKERSISLVREKRKIPSLDPRIQRYMSRLESKITDALDVVPPTNSSNEFVSILHPPTPFTVPNEKLLILWDIFSRNDVNGRGFIVSSLLSQSKQNSFPLLTFIPLYQLEYQRLLRNDTEGTVSCGDRRSDVGASRC